MGSLLKESRLMAEGRESTQTSNDKSPKHTISSKMFVKANSADESSSLMDSIRGTCSSPVKQTKPFM